LRALRVKGLLGETKISDLDEIGGIACKSDVLNEYLKDFNINFGFNKTCRYSLEFFDPENNLDFQEFQFQAGDIFLKTLKIRLIIYFAGMDMDYAEPQL